MTLDHQQWSRAQLLDELAPTGAIRLAANLANATVIRAIGPGRYAGPVADLADRMAGLLGCRVTILAYESGGEILAHGDDWDAAVLAVDPGRKQLTYVLDVATVRATLACRRDDPARRCADADRPACRIATAKGAAYEAHLLRTLRDAEVVPFATPAESRAALFSGDCDFVAGIRPTLEEHMPGGSAFRLLPDDVLTLPQGLAVKARHRVAAANLQTILAEEGPDRATATNGR